MSRIDRCRVCEGPIEEVLDLGDMAFTGRFPKPGEEVPWGRLALALCQGECGLVQLADSFDLNDLYGPTYGYRSGLNKGMVNHLEGLSKRLQQTVHLDRSDVIVDVGSSDGTLLGFMPERCARMGVDPASTKYAGFYPEGVEAIADFFPNNDFEAWLGTRKVKLLTSIAMFYDLYSPLTFAQEVSRVLAEDGIWHTEQSYLPAMLQQNAFDTICHEHLEYYGLTQLAYIAKQAGLKIVDVAFNKVNGGSFGVSLAHVDGPYEEDPRVGKIIREEHTFGLRHPGTYKQFMFGVDKMRSRLLTILEGLPERAWGYGASTKGNVLLQYYGLNRGHLNAIIDVNPDKHGCLTPGTNIPIVGEEAMPDGATYLVLPWHFKEGILAREADRAGSKFIFPLPNPEVVSV